MYVGSDIEDVGRWIYVMLVYSIAPLSSPVGNTFVQALLISMITNISHVSPGRRQNTVGHT